MEQWQVITSLASVISVAVGGLIGWRWHAVSRVNRSAWNFVLRSIACILLCLTLVCAGGWWWYYHRGLPEPIEKPLFQGVDYSRQCRESPRKIVVHTVTVDLNSPGIGFLVTPGNPKDSLPLAGRTTSDFARAENLQIAINGDFFHPWHSKGPFDFYPRNSDPVAVLGTAVSLGTRYSQPRGAASVTMFLDRHNRVSFSEGTNEVYNAISGDVFLVREGVVQPVPDHPRARVADPRSAIGLDRSGTRLLLVVVDGRQPGYSEGITFGELATFMLELGADTAINLDGGGSSTLSAEVEPGKWRPLNSPIHTRIPYRERPVANHLGVRAKRLAL